jgi:hypothetical protein
VPNEFGRGVGAGLATFAFRSGDARPSRRGCVDRDSARDEPVAQVLRINSIPQRWKRPRGCEHCRDLEPTSSSLRWPRTGRSRVCGATRRALQHPRDRRRIPIETREVSTCGHSEVAGADTNQGLDRALRTNKATSPQPAMPPAIASMSAPPGGVQLLAGRGKVGSTRSASRRFVRALATLARRARRGESIDRDLVFRPGLFVASGRALIAGW